MDFFLKKSVAKFSGRSKKIAKLAADTNICIVLENEFNFKKLFVKTKVALIKKTFLFYGEDWENTVNNNCF